LANVDKRALKITIDSVEYTGKISNGSVTAADSQNSFVTFEDAAAGGLKDWFLNLTLAQDAATGALWRKIWDETGTDVPFELRPYGNATPTATEPHFTGTATISLPDGDVLGGDADADPTAVQTVTVQWKCLAKPTLVTS